MAVGGRPDKIGKYEIVDDIGGGGMGKVYKARDPRMRRTVAIKVIKGDFSAEPEFLKRFDIEAQALASLVHPNIVVVHDLGDEQGSPYLVMEYLDGTPLDKIIAQRQNVPLVQKLGIVIDVLNALHYAHQHEIIHRDVKPPNVMVLKTGTVKLLDFGIAREGDTGGTKTGLTMGTEWYMSPEQLNSEVADARSDIYAAGILLYEVLAYSLPFDPRDRTGMIVKRLRGDPPPPLSKYLESYPPELDEIIARALAANRENRYSTAEEFAFELARVQDRLKRDMVSHYVSQARESIARSDLTKARQILSEVIRLDTQNQTAKQLLYEIQQISLRAARKEKKDQLRDQAAGALAAKQLEAAEKFAEEAIRLDANDTDLLNLREQIELAKGRAEQVKKLLALANMAQQTGQLDMAKRAVDDALALDPQHTDAKLMGSAIARLMIEYERQHEIQQFLQAARREIEARQFAAAQENIAKAKAIDPAYPEIAGLERMFNAGREQEARQRELAQLCKQIEQELGANKPKAARDIASNALRKYPGEPSLVKLRTAADIAVERHERQAYIEERIATASRLVDGAEASRALALLKEVERDYPTDTRLREYVQAVREAVIRESVAREKQTLLQKARNAMRGKSFAEAISVLESGLVQFPEDAEIKDLLKTARDEFHLLSKKKQVDDVSKQAQELLQSRAHTDAIRLLERTSAQVSDPELAKLLEYARNEAARFRTGLQEVSEQASNMLNLGQHSEAVTFLEAHADKYGKNADFQVLLEQARNQAEGTRRAKARLQTNLKDARAKLRMHDTYGAEALLHLCEREASDDPDVIALAVEIEEEKKAEERRQGEASRLAQEKAATERREAESARIAQEKIAAERREQEAARELEARAAAASSKPAFDSAGATVLDGSAGASATAMMSSDASAAAVARAGLEEAAPLSATQAFGSHAPAVEASVLTPPPIEVAPTPGPAPSKKEGPSKKRKGKAVEATPAAIETVIAPAPKRPLESAPLAVPTIVREPEPVAPPRPPKRPEPPPPQPAEAEPPNYKRPLIIAGGAVAIVLLAVVGWLLINNSKPAKPKENPPVATLPGAAEKHEPPKPTTAILKIIGAPPGAKFSLGGKSNIVGADGTATVEISPGKYTLEMDAPDFKHYSRSVPLKLGENEPITPDLVPLHQDKFGTLLVKAPVDHFDVFVDGQLKSNSGSAKQAKIQLPEGPHKIQVKRKDFEDSSIRSVEIVAKGELKTPPFDLKPAKPVEASLSVTVRQPGAKIRIDNGDLISLQGGTYSGKLTPGPHKIEASADGYQPQSQNIAVNAGEARSVPFDLPPNPTPKPLPTVAFSAEPSSIEQGKSATLTWTVKDANQVSIDPPIATGKLDTTGKLEVHPATTTNYTLTAVGQGGQSNATRQVVVVAKVEPPQPKAEAGSSNSPEVPKAEIPKVDNAEAIRKVRDGYVNAINSRNPDQMQIIWPGLNKSQREGLTKPAGVKLHVEEDCAGAPNISGTGDAASWMCHDISTYSPDSGSPMKKETVVTFSFKRNTDGKWTISKKDAVSK